MASRKSSSNGNLQRVRLATVLGQVVALRRRELGMQQGQLATKMGVAPGTASKIEAGELKASVDQIWRLASALGMPSSELLARLERAVAALRESGVGIAVSRDEANAELTAAMVGGLLGVLLARK